jgi:hypothetical protein
LSEQNYILGTVNAIGLKVHAFLVDQVNQNGNYLFKKTISDILFEIVFLPEAFCINQGSRMDPEETCYIW